MRLIPRHRRSPWRSAVRLAVIAIGGAFLFAVGRTLASHFLWKRGLVVAANSARNPGVAVEKTDAPLGLYAALAGGLVAFIGISIVALRLIYPSAVSGPSDAPRGESAAPRLQISAPADLAAHRAAEQRQLTGYGWVNQQAGIVHIPIDQAMRDVANTGIPDWPKDAK